MYKMRNYGLPSATHHPPVYFYEERVYIFCMASLATGGETIYYVSDVKYFSRLKSEKYSSKKDMVSAHINYVARRTKAELGSPEVILENAERYDKRVDSRVAMSFVVALPNGLELNEYLEYMHELRERISSMWNIPEEYLYLGLHTGKGVSGHENAHVHVVATPRTRDGRALSLKPSDLQAFHKAIQDWLTGKGWTIRKSDDPIDHIGPRMRYDTEALNAYREYLRQGEEAERIEKEIRQEIEDIRNELEQMRSELRPVKGKSPVLPSPQEQEKGFPLLAEHEHKQQKQIRQNTANRSEELERQTPNEDLQQNTILEDEDMITKQQRERELDEIKRIHPRDVARLIGMEIVYESSLYVLAKAPYRTDRNPSLGIRETRTGHWVWKDFATGETGSWIDLLLRMGYDYKEAVKELRELAGLETGQRKGQKEEGKGEGKKEGKEEKRTYTFTEAKRDDLLRKVLVERGYDEDEIPDFVKVFEVRTEKGSGFMYGVYDENGNVHARFILKPDEKRILKAGQEKATFTHLKKSADTIYVVEGLHDAIAIANTHPDADILVLNSINNTVDALQYLKDKDYSRVVIATDTDEAGQKASAVLLRTLPNSEIAEYGHPAKDPDELYLSVKELIEDWDVQSMANIWSNDNSLARHMLSVQLTRKGLLKDFLNELEQRQQRQQQNRQNFRFRRPS